MCLSQDARTEGDPPSDHQRLDQNQVIQSNNPAVDMATATGRVDIDCTKHTKLKKAVTKAVGCVDINNIAAAVAAAKLGLTEQLTTALENCDGGATAKDADGRTCLHYAAGYGHEGCVEVLLAKGADPTSQDSSGDGPLHFAAIHGHPMCAYNIAKACPAACLLANTRSQTPVEVAVTCERGEVLNAMLLACAGDSREVAVGAMKKLLGQGAVPDTWAPNGSSALMLAAAANGTEALKVLLGSGATLELQDALGRSALMFAAGNCAVDALQALLQAGASLALRDRRGRGVLDYAPDSSAVRVVLEERLRQLEEVAARRQQDLLDSLESEARGGRKQAPGDSKGGKVLSSSLSAADTKGGKAAEGKAGKSGASKKKKAKQAAAARAAGAVPREPTGRAENPGGEAEAAEEAEAEEPGAAVEGEGVVPAVRDGSEEGAEGREAVGGLPAQGGPTPAAAAAAALQEQLAACNVGGEELGSGEGSPSAEEPDAVSTPPILDTDAELDVGSEGAGREGSTEGSEGAPSPPLPPKPHADHDPAVLPPPVESPGAWQVVEGKKRPVRRSHEDASGDLLPTPPQSFSARLATPARWMLPSRLPLGCGTPPTSTGGSTTPCSAASYGPLHTRSSSGASLSSLAMSEPREAGRDSDSAERRSSTDAPWGEMDGCEGTDTAAAPAAAVAVTHAGGNPKAAATHSSTAHSVHSMGRAAGQPAWAALPPPPPPPMMMMLAASAERRSLPTGPRNVTTLPAARDLVSRLGYLPPAAAKAQQAAPRAGSVVDEPTVQASAWRSTTGFKQVLLGLDPGAAAPPQPPPPPPPPPHAPTPVTRPAPPAPVAVAEAPLAAGAGAPAEPAVAVDAGTVALRAEVASLRAEVASLKLAARRRESVQQAELAAVLEDAAAHECEEVERARQEERLRVLAQLQALGLPDDVAALLLLLPPEPSAMSALAQSPLLAPMMSHSTSATSLMDLGLNHGGSDPWEIRPPPQLFPSSSSSSLMALGSSPPPPASMHLGPRTPIQRPTPNGGSSPFCSSLAASPPGPLAPIALPGLRPGPTPPKYSLFHEGLDLRSEFAGGRSSFVDPAREERLGGGSGAASNFSSFSRVLGEGAGRPDSPLEMGASPPSAKGFLGPPWGSDVHGEGCDFKLLPKHFDVLSFGGDDACSLSEASLFDPCDNVMSHFDATVSMLPAAL